MGGARGGAERPASQSNRLQQKACFDRRLPSEARFFVMGNITKNMELEACRKVLRTLAAR